jgi:hypothetical protein
MSHVLPKCLLKRPDLIWSYKTIIRVCFTERTFYNSCMENLKNITYLGYTSTSPCNVRLMFWYGVVIQIMLNVVELTVLFDAVLWLSGICFLLMLMNVTLCGCVVMCGWSVYLIYSCLGFDVFIAVTVKIAVFWNVLQCSLVDIYHL